MSEAKNNVSKGTRITEEEYTRIKMLTDTDLRQSVIARITERASATIGMIRKSKDYEDYRAIVAEHVAKIYERQNAKKAGVAPRVETVKAPTEPEQKVTFVTDMDKVVSSVNNLTEAVITMTAVVKDVATQMAIDKSKSFLRR